MRIAERALTAADAALAQAVHEKAGFLAYHAFESIGGAYCESRGVQYHPATHAEKLSRFVDSCRQERFAIRVAALAAEVASLRNALLYPRAIHAGGIQLPERVITAGQAMRLIGRIRTLTGRVAGTL